jgi:hypothetical protein
VRAAARARAPVLGCHLRLHGLNVHATPLPRGLGTLRALHGEAHVGCSFLALVSGILQLRKQQVFLTAPTKRNQQ